VAKNQLDQYLRPLTGNEVVTVEKLDYSWFIRIGSGITVATESLWRLIGKGRILVASDDHGHQFGLPEPVDAGAALLLSVRGRSVTAAEIDPSCGDLTIDFGEGIRLQFLQTSLGYESWRLSAEGVETICSGGGEIIHVLAR
jgi:hypothetical protein